MRGKKHVISSLNKLSLELYELQFKPAGKLGKAAIVTKCIAYGRASEVSQGGVRSVSSGPGVQRWELAGSSLSISMSCFPPWSLSYEPLLRQYITQTVSRTRTCAPPNFPRPLEDSDRSALHQYASVVLTRVIFFFPSGGHWEVSWRHFPSSPSGLRGRVATGISR